MSKKTDKETSEISNFLVSISGHLKEAEEHLANNNLAGLCRSLKNIEQVSNHVRRDIELKYGVSYGVSGPQ